MRKIPFGLVWALILLAAAYDGYYAWQNRAGFEGWELNPLARWLARSLSFEAVLGLKAFGMAFAVVMAAFCHYRRHRLEVPLTALIGCLYLVLAVHYLVSHLQVEEAPRALVSVAGRAGP